MTIRQLTKLLQQLPEKFKDATIYYPYHGEYDTSSITVSSIDPVLEDGKLAFRVSSHNGSTKKLIATIEELHKRATDAHRQVVKAIKRGFLKTIHTSRPKDAICCFDPGPYSCMQTRDPYEMARKIVKNYCDKITAKDKTECVTVNLPDGPINCYPLSLPDGPTAVRHDRTKWISINLPDGSTNVRYCLADFTVKYEISKVVKDKFKIRWTIRILQKPVEVSRASRERVDPATLYNLVDVYIFDSHYKIYPEYESISLTGCDDY
jgi:hypothetical protein